jgi:hypothetical protein
MAAILRRLLRVQSRRADGEHAVEAFLDELVGDLGVDREDAPLLAAAGRERLADGPVRDDGHERGRVVRLAVLKDEQEAEHARQYVSRRSCPARSLNSVAKSPALNSTCLAPLADVVWTVKSADAMTAVAESTS